MTATKHVALVAHDYKKDDLLAWAERHRDALTGHHLYATGTTGRLLQDALGLDVHRFQSGPLGGDQQLGARIAEDGIDVLIFFWDPLQAQPHDPDVKALLRIAVVWNVAVACNETTADYLVASPLMAGPYERLRPDYGGYLQRDVRGAPAPLRSGQR